MASGLPLAIFGWIIHSASAWRVQRETSLRTSQGSLEGYTFTQFAREFGRSYVAGSQEFARRATIFDASLADVISTNKKNAEEGRSWKAGIHPFMDWSNEERKALNGYKPPKPRNQRLSLLHQGASASLNTSDISGGIPSDAGPHVRQQGNCGSCWAISAVEAVEAQLARAGAGEVRLAAQVLVDCVPNPQHCGGSGGCDGATGELAYAFMRDHGIPLESEIPYRARTETCPQALTGAWQSSTRVRVDGWNQLPSNQVEPLKTALVQQGPVVVAVDGNNWFNYDSGIFDSCDKDAILGHAVLAKGYGQEGGKSFWLIQNSWGHEWGERGHIRLLMHDNEEQWCGTDRKPQEGVGCDGGPPEVTVCGACGILYDPIVPQGVRLEHGAGTAQEQETSGQSEQHGHNNALNEEAQMAALLGYGTETTA